MYDLSEKVVPRSRTIQQPYYCHVSNAKAGPVYHKIENIWKGGGSDHGWEIEGDVRDVSQPWADHGVETRIHVSQAFASNVWKTQGMSPNRGRYTVWRQLEPITKSPSVYDIPIVTNWQHKNFSALS